MERFLALLFATLLVAPTALHAQRPDRPRLDAEQRDLVRETMDAHDGDLGASWYAAAALHESLTPEQRDRLTERLDDAGRYSPRMRGDRGRRSGPHERGWRQDLRGPMMGRLTDELDLTDAQIDELRSTRAVQRQAMCEQHLQQLRAVLDEDQDARLDSLQQQRAARRAAMQTARAEALNLTAEQQAQLQEAGFGPPPAGFRGQRSGSFQARMDAAREILSDEQQEILATHHVLMRQQRSRW